MIDMTPEYSTIRVDASTVKAVKRLQRVLSRLGAEAMPESARDVTIDPRSQLVPKGKVIKSALNALRRELVAAGAMNEDDEEDDDE